MGHRHGRFTCASGSLRKYHLVILVKYFRVYTTVAFDLAGVFLSLFRCLLRLVQCDAPASAADLLAAVLAFLDLLARCLLDLDKAVPCETKLGLVLLGGLGRIVDQAEAR